MPWAVMATRRNPRSAASATDAAPSTPRCAQALDDLRVVDHVADRGDRAGALGRGFDDLERAPHAPAVAQLLGDDDALAGLLPGCRGFAVDGRGR